MYSNSMIGFISGFLLADFLAHCWSLLLAVPVFWCFGFLPQRILSDLLTIYIFIYFVFFWPESVNGCCGIDSPYSTCKQVHFWAVQYTVYTLSNNNNLQNCDFLPFSPLLSTYANRFSFSILIDFSPKYINEPWRLFYCNTIVWVVSMD